MDLPAEWVASVGGAVGVAFTYMYKRANKISDERIGKYQELLDEFSADKKALTKEVLAFKDKLTEVHKELARLNTLVNLQCPMAKECPMKGITKRTHAVPIIRKHV